MSKAQRVAKLKQAISKAKPKRSAAKTVIKAAAKPQPKALPPKRSAVKPVVKPMPKTAAKPQAAAAAPPKPKPAKAQTFKAAAAQPSPKTNSKPNAALDEAALLQAVLRQVAFDGWSRQALVRGAEAAGMHDGHIDLTYPNGVRDAVAAFGAWATALMQAKLAQEKLFARMRVRDKVSFAVRTRLEILTPHREAMRQLCLWYALPHHAPEALKNLAQLGDIIWQLAGDTSTDFNFYTKRGLLAGVIQATTLFWLSDESDAQSASWAFLDRRIDDVLLVGKTVGQLRDLPQHFGKLTLLADIADLAGRFRRAG
jgi:ubiquinone biosynthesis protein COQ9